MSNHFDTLFDELKKITKKYVNEHVFAASELLYREMTEKILAFTNVYPEELIHEWNAFDEEEKHETVMEKAVKLLELWLPGMSILTHEYGKSWHDDLDLSFSDIVTTYYNELGK